MNAAKILICAVLFALGASGAYPQADTMQSRSIPEDLLRPRRGEDPRYPVDTVIGAMGQGRASKEAYEFARTAAAALLEGNMDAPTLSTVNKVFLESCMSLLEAVSPRFFRLGSGREEPDGAVSFLVRFIGREQGITGELFIRFEEKRPEPASGGQPSESGELKAEEAEAGEQSALEQAQAPVEAPPPAQTPKPVSAPAQKVWVFEDLILEEPRTREAENQDSRHRFDFPPYERFF